MLKKIKGFPGYLWEKIFKRKALRESRLDVSFLKDRVKLLAEGEDVALDQHERNMILSAIEYVPFREAVELPETKAWVRKVYRRLREKIQLSIKADRVPDRMDIPKEPSFEPEVKEDDETKEAPLEGFAREGATDDEIKEAEK